MTQHDKRITVPLSIEEFDALSKSARIDYRHPREQARHILRWFLLGETVQENSKSATSKVSEAEQMDAFAESTSNRQ